MTTMIKYFVAEAIDHYEENPREFILDSIGCLAMISSIFMLPIIAYCI